MPRQDSFQAKGLMQSHLKHGLPLHPSTAVLSHIIGEIQLPVLLPGDAFITGVGMAAGDTHPMDTHLHAWRHFSWWDHASLSSCKEKCYLLAASAAFYLNVHFDPFSVGTWLHLKQAKSGCQAHHSLPSPCPFRVVGCGFTLGEC